MEMTPAIQYIFTPAQSLGSQDHYKKSRIVNNTWACWCIRELTILGRERRPRLHKTKTAITEFKTVQLCRKYNLKDLLSA